MPSNRSPSPLSSRPNSPHHPTKMESDSTMRRSFSGNAYRRPSILTSSKSFNPVTPANSPAGFGGRISVGKEGMGQLLSCCDEKENDKEHQTLKSVKIRLTANGSKNFMSPTISAASKFTPSPRKKPLVERNEQVRTSISLSDGKATFFSAISSEKTEDSVLKSEQNKDEGCLDSPVVTHLEQNDAVLECHPASKAMKKVTFAELPSDSNKSSGLPSISSDTVTIDSDCFDVETNPQEITSSFSVSSVIAPLDADPSVLPYDPKLNYLSPRPQFLRYKPNPRFEFLLQNREKGFDSEVKQLDDSFVHESSSETFSDTDGVEESSSYAPYKDSEDSSSAEIEESEVMEEDEEESLSDKSDISTPISCETTEKKTVVGKRRFFKIMKFASLLLLFFVGVISVSVAVMNSSVIKRSDFSELRLPPAVSDMAKSHFEAYSRRFKELSLDSINYLSFLVMNLSGPSITPQFINLTDIQKKEVWQMHASGEKFSLEVCQIAIGRRGTGKITDKFEKEDMEVQENGESVPFEEDTLYLEPDDINETKLDGENDLSTQEFIHVTVPVVQEQQVEEPETYVEVDSDDTHETATDCEIDLGNQEFTEEPEIYDEVVSDDTRETAIDVEIELGNQEFIHNVAPPVQQMEECDTYVGVVSDDSGETELDGEIQVGNQELISTSEYQMKEPGSLETVSFQEEEEGASNDDVEVKSHISLEEEGINEEKVSEIQPELLPQMILDDSRHKDITPLEKVKSPIGASIVLLSLISAAAAYVYLNRGSSGTPTPTTITTKKPTFGVHSDQFLLSSKKIIPETSALEQQQQQIHHHRHSSSVVDVMMMEEETACSSEMSNFQTRPSSSSHSKRLRKQSKRDSLASSSEYSTHSPSYGSFTTYEKIPSKNIASGDDEIMTPVRRSSRIRSRATSP